MESIGTKNLIIDDITFRRPDTCLALDNLITSSTTTKNTAILFDPFKDNDYDDTFDFPFKDEEDFGTTDDVIDNNTTKPNGIIFDHPLNDEVTAQKAIAVNICTSLNHIAALLIIIKLRMEMTTNNSYNSSSVINNNNNNLVSNVGSNLNSSTNTNDNISLPVVINHNNSNKVNNSYIQKYSQHHITKNSKNTTRTASHNNNNKNKKKFVNNNEANNRFSGVELEDLVGHIYSLCKDQHGCRFLQRKLEENNQKYIETIYNEVNGHFVELITDPFGNYLCQKLFEHCDEFKRTQIINKVSSELGYNNNYIYKTQQIRTFIQSLNPEVVTLIQDLNGNHVIQKCLRLFTPEENQAISSYCLEVATHKNGCCVFQRCIDHGTEQQKLQLLKTIIHHALFLSQDKYGNYVVQYAINFNIQQFTNALARKILGHVYPLSIQQCSSNVVEACIKLADNDIKELLISELINCRCIDRLLQDSFGNYLIKSLQPFLPTIHNAPYGRKVQGRISRDIKFLGSLLYFKNFN
ncbi:4205_t:CDS:10 [Entrophospora sp. SA101]|nr:16027_t:CDS:10 [Entrophospora sp. SA101]CAJ0753392.1 4205_t:CDS:10 [Entrophospora sp. SA101]CAJ0906950.1 11924_t:CDS:10 [Entrophospora sp. SA101]